MNIFKRKNATEETIPTGGEKESGVSGDSVFSNFDHEVEREDKISIKDYRKMRDTDATVEALYNVVTRPILAATCGIKADSDDKNEEQADFIRQCLFEPPYKGGMETPFPLVLEQMLKSIMDGFEVFERVYRYDVETGKIVLRKIALRDAATISLKVDEHGGYDGIRQRASFGGKSVDISLPAEKTFLITYGKADDLLYGRSAFRSIHANWDKKRKIEYLDSIAIQNSAVRPKILQRISNAITKAEDVSDKKLLSVISRLGHLKPVARIPNGFDVKELEGGNNSGTHQSIERQNSEMARAFLANFMLLGTQGKSSSGSYSLSSDQSDLFMLSLKGVMNLIVSHINQYWIANLIDLNFPRGKRHYPEFYFDSFTDEMTDFMKAIFTKLIEKDRVSDAVVSGIEDSIISRFEIDVDEDAREADRNSSTDDNSKDGGSNGKSGSDGELGGNNGGMSDGLKAEKEDNGDNAVKFLREPTEFEEKVNWASIDRQSIKIAEAFEKEATPILSDYIKKVAESPEDEIALPTEYIKLLTNSYRSAYNYGKMSASDEEGQKAPKTKESELLNTERFVEFITEKQTSDIRNLILEQKMNAPLVDESTLASNWSLKDLILVAGLKWVTQAVGGTMESIFGHGMNAGRNDAFAIFDQQESAVYMWSALLENSCDLCSSLDGSILTRKQLDESKYQPGKVHRKCRCITVRITGEKKPTPTGLPDDIDDLDHFVNTSKAQLQKEGLVGKDETKVNALRRQKLSNANNGETLDEVENAIRSQDFETMAAFSSKGKKLFEWTDNERSSVSPPKEWAKYYKDNDGSIITHNHPSSSSFSTVDLVTAAKHNIYEMRIASREYDYSLKSPNGWPDAKELEAFADKQEDMFNRQAERLVRAGKLDSSHAWSWVIDKKVGAVANKYGLIYNKNERR